jgi:two-component system, OmpR family, response regulator RegX3
VPDDSERVVILTRNPAAVEELRKVLAQAGYRARIATTLEDAVVEPDGAHPALILIDRPHVPLETLPSVRSDDSAPTLFVSVWPVDARLTEDQYVQEFEAGVDDLVSGQTHRQIVAKIRALLRRRRIQREPPRMLAAGVRMDLDRHEVTVNGRLIALTRKEFAILRCFLAAPGRVFSRDEMLNNVWGEGYALEEHALDVHIHALRHKIEPNPGRPSMIVTVRGLGYKWKAG